MLALDSANLSRLLTWRLAYHDQLLDLGSNGDDVQQGGETPIMIEAAFCMRPKSFERRGAIHAIRRPVCLEGVVTDPGYRGRGIAPAAWSMIARSLQDEGIRTIAMKVEEANQSMRRAVMKAGFHEMAITDFRRVAGITRVHVVPAGTTADQDAEIYVEVQKLTHQ